MDSQDKDDRAAEMVVVAVADCSLEDARTVLDLLEEFFPAEAEAEAGAAGAVGASGRTGEGVQVATVWTATLDAARSAEPAEWRTTPVRLKDTVSVTLQGGPRAVERMHAALAGHFTVEDTGTVSGDQEKEIGLRIRS
ncbi:hypothetical protein OG429_01140 [Streptomyces sp. NBC_00190]|uniref:hypothetical protein n=1 Tax=unclassified Streptomyces TaxID=2593676 RepID=UPI002E2D4FDC|nr:hypothetical protein [Streptomyces sp. NBC_00190]WSZ38068.1 hypothetical protein OG239_04130 [Streptomyces sp. NBC_00868]